MSSLIALRQGRYAVLQADLDNGLTSLGVLLEDPDTDQLYVRLRRDWDVIAPDDPVLPLLEQDLELKAAEMGAEKLFAWLEEHASANIRTTDRETVTVGNFDQTLNRLYSRHISTARRSATHVPLYSLRSAAGQFLENEEVEPEDWEELPAGVSAKKGMFAAHIVGTSMEPLVPDGSVALFQYEAVGSRQGRLVLVEEKRRGGGSAYTLKRYTSRKVQTEDGSWRHNAIVLEPLNREHEPIVLTEDEDRYRVLAWFVDVLY
jgi:SOS-response transcriptional repressor LexA